jgi:hypothetical protein
MNSHKRQLEMNALAAGGVHAFNPMQAGVI